MKYFLFLLLLSFVDLSSRAQDQFIEVVVSDTMIVEPQEWQYFLMLHKPPPTKPNDQKGSPPLGKVLDSIRAIAISSGGEITGDINMPLNFTLTPKSFVDNADPQYLNIRFTNRTALEYFIRATRYRGDIEGRVIATAHKDLPPFTDKLNAKLVDQARQKAALLARLSNKGVGAILQISEVADPEANLYQDIFGKMLEADRSSWLPGWHTQSIDYPTDKIKLEKTLRLRFALL